MRIKLMQIAGARSGDKGKHSRIAMGVACLPLNSMTEIDAVIEFSE